MNFFCWPSPGTVNTSTSSIFMDGTTEFRSMAELLSVKMPVKSGFPGSGCMKASDSGMNTTSRPVGRWMDVRLERTLPWDAKRALPVCTGGSRAAPPEDCCGAMDYLERMDSHRREMPIEDFVLMAEALQTFFVSR